MRVRFSSRPVASVRPSWREHPFLSTPPKRRRADALNQARPVPGSCRGVARARSGWRLGPSRAQSGRARHSALPHPSEIPKVPIANGESATVFGEDDLPATRRIRPAARSRCLEQSAPKSGLHVGRHGDDRSQRGLPGHAAGLHDQQHVLRRRPKERRARTGRSGCRRRSPSVRPLRRTARSCSPAGGRKRKHPPVTFAGEVSPLDAGAIVVLQRESATANEEWRAIGRGHGRRAGKYSIAHTFGVPGDANIRVVVHPRKAQRARRPRTALLRDLPGAEPGADDRKHAPTRCSTASRRRSAGVVAGAAADTPVTLLARDTRRRPLRAGGDAATRAPAARTSSRRRRCRHRLPVTRRAAELGGAVRGRQIRADGRRRAEHRRGRPAADVLRDGAAGARPGTSSTSSARTRSASASTSSTWARVGAPANRANSAVLDHARLLLAGAGAAADQGARRPGQPGRREARRSTSP